MPAQAVFSLPFLMRYILASVRFAAFVLATCAIYGVWWTVSWVVPNSVLWRQVVFHWWSRAFKTVGNMKLEIVGTPPKPPFFLVCNHVSYVDVPVLRLAANGIFVAKQEVKDWFLAGAMIRNMGNVFIDRKNRRDIPRAGRELGLSEGERYPFPEPSTRARHSAVQFIFPESVIHRSSGLFASSR